jgi:hypothetical protein
MENQAEQKTNAGQGLGIAALVLGCISFPISFIPCFNVSAILFAVVGIILSAIGLSQATKQNGAKGLNLAGLILSGLALLIIVAWSLAISNEFINKGRFPHEIRRAFKDDFSKDIEKEIEEATSEINSDLEKQLEALESDSTASFVEAESNAVDDLLKDYETTTKEIISLSEKIKQKDLTAVSQYAKAVSKSAILTTKLMKAAPDMTGNQKKRFAEAQKKYEEALRKAGN